MKLLLVELTRLRWRRAVLLMLIAGALLGALVFGSTAWNTRPVSDADRDAALVQAERDHEMSVRECREHPEGWGVQDPSDCETMFGEPMAENYLWRDVLSVDLATDAATGVAFMALGLALLLGASYAGADWASGSMSNQLLFQPRRTRVWLAKAATAMVGGLAVALLAAAVFWVPMALLFGARDVSVSGDEWRELLAVTGRGLVLASFAALGTFALTMLLRSTVGAMGVLFATAIASGSLVGLLPIEGAQRWALHNNALGIMFDGYEYYDESLPGCDMGMGTCTAVATTAEAVTYFGVVLVLVLLVSWWSFRRRDVP